MSDKKCPQCGLWSLEAALVCDCGYDFSRGAPLYTVKPVDRNAGKRARSARRLSRFGLAAGLLAVLPYILILVLLLLRISGPMLRLLAMFSLLTGFFFGALFGLAGILLGILGWALSLKKSGNLAFSVPAILLGVAGILGNIWFFATCQFCQ